MDVSVDSTGVVRQYGQSLGDLDGCDIVTVDDELLPTLQEPGIKTWDGTTITVTPDTSAADAQAAAEKAAADRQALIDAALATLPDDASRALWTQLLR